MKRIQFPVMLILLLVACTENQPLPTATIAASDTPTITRPPTSTPTLTPTSISTTMITPTTTQTDTLIPSTAILKEKLPEEIPRGILSDLIWLQDGALLRWDTKNQEIINWVGIESESIVRSISKVIDFQLTNEKELILVLENGTIGMIDKINNLFLEKTTVNYLTDTPSYRVSPDGMWLAYATIEASTENVKLYGYYLLNLQVEAQPMLIGSCVLHPWTFVGWCESNFVWTNNSSTLAWDGQQGLWTVNPGEDPKFITFHQTYLVDGFYYSFVPEEWSSNGRYLYAFGTGWDGYAVYLIDTETGRTQLIPRCEAGWGVESSYQLTWLSDGRLLTIWNPHYDWADHEAIIYQMSPYGEEILSLSRQVLLPFTVGTLEDGPPSEIVISIQPIDNKIIMLTDEVNYQEGVNLSIRELSISNLTLSESTQLFVWEDEGHSENVYWTNDGKWALWENLSDGNAALISFSTGEVVQLENLFNETSCCFEWVVHED